MGSRPVPARTGTTHRGTDRTSRPAFGNPAADARAFTARAKILAGVSLRSGARALMQGGDPRLLIEMRGILARHVEDARARQWLLTWFDQDGEPPMPPLITKAGTNEDA